MNQKLAISAIAKVARPEPHIVDVTVILIDGTTALLRLNAFTAQTLFKRLAAIVQQLTVSHMRSR